MKQKKLKIPDLSQLNEMPSIGVVKNCAEELNSIIDGVKNSKFEDGISKSLTNYVIIRSISLIEHFCRNLTREAIDEYDFEPDEIFENNEVLVNISDLKKIKENEQLSLGRIISNHINFQDWDNIHNTFSTLLKGKDFRDRLKELGKKATGSVYGIKLELDLNVIYELFELRHNIVHKMSEKKIVNLKKLKKSDYKAWAYGLKKAGYATDKRYAEKLIYIIEEMELYQYDL